MAVKIRIRAGAVQAAAELHDTPTSRAIAAALPITAEALTWGEEIYFPIPVNEPLEPTAKEVVEMGDLAYWPTGKAFCIFFGPTPMSRGNEIRAASAVNVVGRMVDDAQVFKQVEHGELVRIERARE